MPKILIVNAHPEYLGVLQDALAGAGYQAEMARYPREAAGALRRLAADGMILYVDRAGIQEIECLRKVREDFHFKNLPVLLVVAMPVKEVIIAAAKLGVQGIIIQEAAIVPRLLARVMELVPLEHKHSSVPVADAESADRPAPPQPTARREAAELSSAIDLAAEPHKPVGDGAPDSQPIINADEGGFSVEEAMAKLRELKPIMSRAELSERVLDASRELKAMGPAARQVLAITSKDAGSIDQVARAIKQDQALALRMLKLANSTMYGRDDRVETVQKAIARIGLAQVRCAVMSVGVIDQFNAVSKVGRSSSTWFWEHSVACGLIASKIARAIGSTPEVADVMFTGGLLHDVGRMIYAEHLSDSYSSVIDTAEELELPLELVESRLLLVNHADLTDRLLRTWKFSSELINPISLHHLTVGNIRRMAPRMVSKVCTLALANRLAHALLLGSSGNDVLYPVEEFVQQLALTSYQFGEIARSVPDEANDLRLGMLMHGTADAKPFLEALRDASDHDIRPLSLAIEPATDPAGMLVRRLWGDTKQETPNVCIMRVCVPDQRARLMRMLSDSEHAEGVKNLPVLVVATSPGCAFGPGMLGGRTVMHTIIPTRISRILRQMRTLAKSNQTITV